jgi:DNA-damage-inducible protein D
MKIWPADFDGQSHRRLYDEDTEIWWFSVIDIIHQEWAGVSLKAHKQAKGLSSHKQRDPMTEAERIFTALAELSTRQIAQSTEATGLEENSTAAQAGGGTARRARQQLENQTGQPVVSAENYLRPPPAKKVARSQVKK